MNEEQIDKIIAVDNQLVKEGIVNGRLINTYNKLKSLGIKVELHVDKVVVLENIKKHNLTPFDLWESIKEFGTTFGVSSDISKLNNFDIVLGYPVSNEIVEMYEEIYNYTEDSISKGFN